MSKPLHFEAHLVGSIASLQPRVELRVEGRSVIELLRETELPHALYEGVPALAGNYAFPLLVPRIVRLLSGERPGTQRIEGVLLNCECDWASCWPFSLRVRVFDRYALWQDFRQLKRMGRWSYRAIDPLRFDREPYLAEVSKLRAALAELAAAQSARRLGNRLRDVHDVQSCAV